MQLIPSLDLMQGRLVRLRHGDPQQATFYDLDPEDWVGSLAEAGTGQPDPGFTGRILLYPDPVKAGNPVFLHFSSGCYENPAAAILDMNGRQLWTGKIPLVPGTGTLKLDVSRYRPGLYLLSIQGEKTRFTGRFIIN